MPPPWTLAWVVGVACAPIEPTPFDPPPSPSPTSVPQVGGAAVSGLSVEGVDGGSLLRIRWHQDIAADAAWAEATWDGAPSVAGDPWQRSPEQASPEGPGEALVVGAPPGAEVQVRVGTRTAGAERLSSRLAFTTPTLPDGLPVPAVDVPWDGVGEGYVLAAVGSTLGGWDSGDFWTVLLDREGGVVWYRLTPDRHWTMTPRLSRDGTHVVVDENTYWPTQGSGTGGTLTRLTLDGQVLEVIPTDGLHHGWDELPDGAVAWGAVDGTSEALRVRTPDGDEREVWSCRDFHRAVGVSHACQSNGVAWIPPEGEAGDGLLISFFTTSTVAEVDLATGTTRRWYGQLGGDWTFEPPEAIFDWQHGVHYSAPGRLLVSSHLRGVSGEQRVRELAVDGDSQTLTEVWSFAGPYAPEGGAATRTSRDTVLVGTGTGGTLYEATAAGEVAWQLSWPPGHLLGHATFVADPYSLLAHGKYP